jgi:hypothetical protein
VRVGGGAGSSSSRHLLPESNNRSTYPPHKLCTTAIGKP